MILSEKLVGVLFRVAGIPYPAGGIQEDRHLGSGFNFSGDKDGGGVRHRVDRTRFHQAHWRALHGAGAAPAAIAVATAVGCDDPERLLDPRR